MVGAAAFTARLGGDPVLGAAVGVTIAHGWLVAMGFTGFVLGLVAVERVFTDAAEFALGRTQPLLRHCQEVIAGLLVLLVNGFSLGPEGGFDAFGLALAGHSLGGGAGLKPRLELGLAFGPVGDQPSQADQQFPDAAG